MPIRDDEATLAGLLALTLPAHDALPDAADREICRTCQQLVVEVFTQNGPDGPGVPTGQYRHLRKPRPELTDSRMVAFDEMTTLRATLVAEFKTYQRMGEVAHAEALNILDLAIAWTDRSVRRMRERWGMPVE